jgi:hypothetical protein
MRAALGALTWIAVWWSAFVVFVYAVLPDLRYEYMPQIRDGNPVQLWLELGRLIRPDVQAALPSFYGPELATPLLGLLWVMVAVFLATLGYIEARRRMATMPAV